ncbi:hypothetical protein PIB30_077253 [Stylosanthes scabra]|uniref:Uncharacterized protein n=1 Tax=Stylosanthes scabra TaxID=79078 RepID=A0ABU6VPN0_9FABA|nr:hypothetical protein [Stylosanthes scabra]
MSNLRTLNKSARWETTHHVRTYSSKLAEPKILEQRARNRVVRTHPYFSPESAYAPSGPKPTKWLEKEKVSQGNHQQELEAHLPAANLRKKLQDMRLLPMRRGVNWLLNGRYSMKGS